MTTILIIIYIIGALVSWPFTARVLPSMVIPGKKIDSIDRVFAIYLGGLFAFFWPLLIPGYFLVRIVYNVAFPSEKRNK